MPITTNMSIFHVKFLRIAGHTMTLLSGLARLEIGLLIRIYININLGAQFVIFTAVLSVVESVHGTRMWFLEKHLWKNGQTL